jgi:hypothetical protein
MARLLRVYWPPKIRTKCTRDTQLEPNSPDQPSACFGGSSAELLAQIPRLC